VSLLADSSSNGPAAGLGLVVFLILLAGCILLFRSMSGRIKRLPASFDPPAADADAEDEPPPAQ
jgi:hypothetical protein